MTYDEKLEKELQEILSKSSVNYKESSPVTLAYPLRHEFINCEHRALFDAAKLSVNQIPTQSTLIKSERRNIGKTLLMNAWRESLNNSIKQIVAAKDDYVRREDSGKIQSWLTDYETDLKKYSNVFYTERKIAEYFNQIENDRENYFNFSYIPKYFFLDDFCYENTYNHSGGKLSQDFINFMRKLLEWLCNNRERIIVIASTNNNPAKILCKPGEIKENSSLYSRFNEIFKNENRIEIK